MKIRTLKIVGMAVLSIFMMGSGVMFAALFAADTLRSLPHALFEALPVFYGQAILGLSLGMAKGKWRRVNWWVSLVFAIVSLTGYAWAIATTPFPRPWFVFWGILSFISVGGMIFGGLVKETFPRAVSYQLPQRKAVDPSLN